MFNPFVNNLDELNAHQLDEKISDLSKKHYAAQRLGKYDLLTQIDVCLNMYKDERAKRYHAKMKAQLDGDLDQLINVD